MSRLDRIKPAIDEALIDRDAARPYAGVIAVGERFAWAPDNEQARALIVVTRISPSGALIYSRPIYPWRGGEEWTDERRFREAVVPTMERGENR